MNLLYIWRLSRQHRALLAAGLLLGLLGGWAATTLPPRYEATASVLVRPRGEADLRLYTGTPERFARSQARIAASDVVFDLTAEQLGGANVRTRLRNDVAVAGGAADDVIDVTVRGSSSDDVDRTAAAVVSAYQSVTSAGTEILGTTVQNDSVSPVRSVPLGAALGVVAALLVVLLVGAVRAPALTTGQLGRALPYRVFPLPLSARLDRPSEVGRLRLVLQYLEEFPGSGCIIVAGLDAPRLETRLVRSLREAATPQTARLIRTLGEHQEAESGAHAVRSVLCCVRVSTPMGRIQEHLASLEVLPGSRLVVMGV